LPRLLTRTLLMTVGVTIALLALAWPRDVRA
jgi:hypothetical protein